MRNFFKKIGLVTLLTLVMGCNEKKKKPKLIFKKNMVEIEVKEEGKPGKWENKNIIFTIYRSSVNDLNGTKVEKYKYPIISLPAAFSLEYPRWIDEEEVREVTLRYYLEVEIEDPDKTLHKVGGENKKNLILRKRVIDLKKLSGVVYITSKL